MSTMVRNNQAGPTTFLDDATKFKAVVWQGAGDPQRQDVRAVPDVFLESVAFQEALENGIFSLVEDPRERAATQAAHRAQFEAMQERQRNVGEGIIDSRPNEDIVVAECIGPKGKTGALCGEQVTLTAAQRGTTPPLCVKHTGLRTQFIPTETGRVVDGNAEVTWSRPHLGQPLNH